MGSGTKKVKSSGRFRAGYGATVRKRVVAVEELQRQKQTCPFCSKVGGKRLAMGIWHCTKCNVKFAGKAYSIE